MNRVSGKCAGTDARSDFHMRRLAITLSVLAAVVFATGLAAQGKDFSGKWAPDADKNPAPMTGATGGTGAGTAGRGMRGASGPMTITQDAKTIKIERSIGNGMSSQSYNLDGSDSKNSMGQGGDRVSNAKWDGAKLVVTTKATQAGRADQVTSYYMDGADLVVETAGANGPVKTFYKKG
jgi:hypothetical protein